MHTRWPPRWRRSAPQRARFLLSSPDLSSSLPFRDGIDKLRRGKVPVRLDIESGLGDNSWQRALAEDYSEEVSMIHRPNRLAVVRFSAWSDLPVYYSEIHECSLKQRVRCNPPGFRID